MLLAIVMISMKSIRLLLRVYVHPGTSRMIGAAMLASLNSIFPVSNLFTCRR
jgi:hypothetical protein